MLLLRYLMCKYYQSPNTSGISSSLNSQRIGKELLKLHDCFLLESFFIKDGFWKSRVFFFVKLWLISGKAELKKRLQNSEISFNEQISSWLKISVGSCMLENFWSFCTGALCTSIHNWNTKQKQNKKYKEKNQNCFQPLLCKADHRMV